MESVAWTQPGSGYQSPVGASNSQPAITLDFRYDGYSRRISKKTTIGVASPLMEGYLYDGWNLVMIAQLNPTNPAATPVRKWSCVWKPDVGSTLYAKSSWQNAGGVGGLAWMQTGIAQTLLDAAGGPLTGAAEVHIPMIDHMGNVRHYYQIKATAQASAESTITGQVSASFEYDSFGREVRATGATVPTSNTPPGLVAGASFADALPFHFSTKFTDQESGLNYYGYRFYDPLDGWWLNRDPIGTRGGLNLYAMLDNNPLSYIDLLGLEKRDCNWAIYHSHGTQKRDDPDNNTQKSINESSPQKCDKLGFSGCHRKSMNQFIEDKHPGKVLPSAERQNDQETLVNGKKPFEDNRNPGDKLPQDGLELIKILEKTKIDAKTEIAKPESCCKSITIHIVCPSPDFQKWYSKEKVGEDGPYCGKTYTIK